MSVHEDMHTWANALDDGLVDVLRRIGPVPQPRSAADFVRLADALGDVAALLEPIFLDAAASADEVPWVLEPHLGEDDHDAIVDERRRSLVGQLAERATAARQAAHDLSGRSIDITELTCPSLLMLDEDDLATEPVAFEVVEISHSALTEMSRGYWTSHAMAVFEARRLAETARIGDEVRVYCLLAGVRAIEPLERYRGTSDVHRFDEADVAQLSQCRSGR